MDRHSIDCCCCEDLINAAAARQVEVIGSDLGGSPTKRPDCCSVHNGTPYILPNTLAAEGQITCVAIWADTFFPADPECNNIGWEVRITYWKVAQAPLALLDGYTQPARSAGDIGAYAIYRWSGQTLQEWWAGKTDHLWAFPYVQPDCVQQPFTLWNFLDGDTVTLNCTRWAAQWGCTQTGKVQIRLLPP